ncbi:hypothetical protein K435DRAFT_833946 [Dendrothele bispora CBS 962.96]|uniref:BHLH domain-containing protein n=1 Tax=Dendrothele bispora (strain CBS 962.96) TaxID=1314807 RepID=A0A4S8MV65_DENBC|nr:hypothetical protein K435DRAFT_833946 [Dendrothele bispora CBS 962.96]
MSFTHDVVSSPPSGGSSPLSTASSPQPITPVSPPSGMRAAPFSTTPLNRSTTVTTGPNNPPKPNKAASNAKIDHDKRRPSSRRPSTAERRATHNAVERARRETLNGRFQDLASLLPNLSQIRRPSKSAIVNSSIAYMHASRRHRLLASRELRLIKLETDSLRREVNEWRDQAGVQRVEEPVRGEGFAIVLEGEVEIIHVPLDSSGNGGMMMEDDEEGFYDDDVGGVVPDWRVGGLPLGGGYQDSHHGGYHNSSMNPGPAQTQPVAMHPPHPPPPPSSSHHSQQQIPMIASPTPSVPLPSMPMYESQIPSIETMHAMNTMGMGGGGGGGGGGMGYSEPGVQTPQAATTVYEGQVPKHYTSYQHQQASHQAAYYNNNNNSNMQSRSRSGSIGSIASLSSSGSGNDPSTISISRSRNPSPSVPISLTPNANGPVQDDQYHPHHPHHHQQQQHRWMHGQMQGGNPVGMAPGMSNCQTFGIGM